MSVDQSWALMVAERFEEALSAYNAEIASSAARSIPALTNRAFALLALRRYGEAFEAFHDADSASAAEGARALLELAQVSWLDGKRSQARDLVHQDMTLLEEERLARTSTPGGLGDGLFGFYVGVRLDDASTARRCASYLIQTLGKPKFAHTEIGRVAQHVLGQAHLESVLETICGATSIDVAWERALDDLSIRRSVVVALFYAGVRELSLERAAAARELFVRSSALKNPLLELEWYLSVYEVNTAWHR